MIMLFLWEHSQKIAIPLAIQESPFIAATAKANKCDVALFGHTHIPFYEVMNDVHVFNPGSPSSPRGRSEPSYGVITISDSGILDFRHCIYEK